MWWCENQCGWFWNLEIWVKFFEGEFSSGGEKLEGIFEGVVFGVVGCFIACFWRWLVPKVQVTFYIDPTTMEYIRARASGEKRSISLVVNELLSDVAAAGLTPADGFDVLLPVLNAGVHQSLNRAVDGLNSRLRHLLEQAVVNSLANRLAVFQLLAVEFGVEEATRIHDEATA
jgi:hypothetical protein